MCHRTGVPARTRLLPGSAGGWSRWLLSRYCQSSVDCSCDCSLHSTMTLDWDKSDQWWWRIHVSPAPRVLSTRVQTVTSSALEDRSNRSDLISGYSAHSLGSSTDSLVSTDHWSQWWPQHQCLQCQTLLMITIMQHLIFYNNSNNFTPNQTNEPLTPPR